MRLRLFIFLILAFAVGLDSQQRSIKIKILNPSGESIDLYRDSFALVVGVSDYTNGWPDLPNALNDALEVKSALERHGFAVTLLSNPIASQLKAAIEDFIASYGIGAQNRLLFYFAGHGHTIKRDYGGNVGYIVPADAPLEHRDRSGFIRKTISMEHFNSYARNIDAKHVLFLFDSCFSGSIFALSRAVTDAISYKTSEPVRQFITSGTEDETVPDRSIFKAQFLEALEGEADVNEDGYVTGTELGTFLQDNVINYSRNSQHPQYGKIRDSQLDKGDFVFVVPTGLADKQPIGLPPTTGGKLDLSHYETEASRQALIKSQWDTWQTNMATSYQKARQLDGDNNLAASSKARMWQEFLNSYRDDNPFSDQDEEWRKYAKNRQQSWDSIPAATPTSTIPVKKTAAEDMVYIPSGSFMMGSNKGEDDEKPVHKVTLDAFYMDKYEVSNAQFCQFLNEKGNQSEGGTIWLDLESEYSKISKSGSRFVPKSGYDNHPVVEVRWYGARAYAQWAGKRLPTEAEWEYAARGGLADKKYPWGDDASTAKANYGSSGTRPVGSYPANGYALYDMAGNVWEWCADWYDKDYYSKSPEKNPTGPANGTSRVCRGGSWTFNEYGIRTATRYDDYPFIRYCLGFRCVR